MTSLKLCILPITLSLSLLAFADAGEGLPKGADTAFVGTVTGLGTATFAAVPISPEVITVRVDKIIVQPQVVDLQEKEKITVKVKSLADFKPGVQAIFYATGWMLGDGTALIEVGHAFPSHVAFSHGDDLNAVSDSVKQEYEAKKQGDLKSRIDSAKLVIVGKIVSIKPAPKNKGGNDTFEGVSPAGEHGEYESEHDPQWKDAIVEVESMIKGSPGTPQVIVRFAGSPDVAWRLSPKLKEGQERTFILQTATEEKVETLGQGTIRAYMAPSKADVLDKAQADLVRRLVNK